MTSRAASIGLVAVLAVALAACTTPREPPQGPSSAETAERVAERIDMAWQNTGLEGVVERPEIVSPSTPATFNRLAECISVDDLAGWSLSDGTKGPAFGMGGQPTTPAQQLMFYSCFAKYPTDPLLGGPRLTLEQLDYLYDYYREWVIPCLALDSIAVLGAPTRDTFRSAPWLSWNPYDATIELRSERERDEAIRRCGSPYADLEIVDPFGVSSVSGFSSFEVPVP